MTTIESVATTVDRQVRRARCRSRAHVADPRTTTIYDRRRQKLDRHAAFVVVAFVAGG
jgi:hypothetical protein